MTVGKNSNKLGYSIYVDVQLCMWMGDGVCEGVWTGDAVCEMADGVWEEGLSRY